MGVIFCFSFFRSIAVFLVAFTCLLGEQVSCGAQIVGFPGLLPLSIPDLFDFFIS